MSYFDLIGLIKNEERPFCISISLIAFIYLASLSMFQMLAGVSPYIANAAEQEMMGRDSTNNAFKLLNESSPIPQTRERILTDEILALGTDIDAIKNASQNGDFKVVYNKTLEVVSGPNWGNISADLLYRKELVSLNNIISSLQTLNTLTKNTTEHSKAINDTIVREGDILTSNYGKVLDALAMPIFDIPKLITNLVIPAAIVVIIVLSIPRIRKRFKIRY